MYGMMPSAKIVSCSSAPPENGDVTLSFATAQVHLGHMRSRAIDTPAWDEIAGNYVPTVQAEMERLATFEPDAGGRLLLWRGDPGTGKTHAVRALMRAWSSWCRSIYITDPEQFFGGQQDYMLDMLTEQRISTVK
ncbi:MAG: hypothetical protein REJ50_11040, partial [Bordetella sp.]|nr:hypothetical protein [Bordetella sp.]